MTNDLHAYARTFPSQGGVEIGPWLEKYASEVPPASNIVELGCWLGAGTAWLALGARRSGAIIYTYDRWQATAEEVDKAASAKCREWFGGVEIKEGDDTLPLVEQRLRKIYTPIVFRQCRIKEIGEWKSNAITLYVDDATKVGPLWEHAMRVFKPHFIPGKTILVLMDYWFFESMREQKHPQWERYACQKNYMEACAKEFELVEDRIGGTTAAVWRWLG